MPSRSDTGTRVQPLRVMTWNAPEPCENRGLLHSAHCVGDATHRTTRMEGQGVNDQEPGFLSDDLPTNGSESPTSGRQHEGMGLGEPAANSTPTGRPGEGSKLIPAQRDATLDRQDAGTITAVHVRMDRSGAEHIDAQRVTMTNSGAKSMSVQSAQLDKSGVLKMSGDRVVFQESSSVVTQTRELRLARSRVGIAMSGTTTIENDSRIGVLQTGNVVAGGDIKSIFLFTGVVRAEGDVNVTFDAVSATALGASLAAVLVLLRRLLKSK